MLRNWGKCCGTGGSGECGGGSAVELEGVIRNWRVLRNWGKCCGTGGSDEWGGVMKN